MRALVMVFLMALASEGYERIGDKHDVVVYRRSGHAIDLGAEGDIDAPPEVVLRVLTDYTSHPKWVHGLALSRVIGQTDAALDVYQRLHLPLLEDRDFTLHVEWGADGPRRFIRFHQIALGPAPTKGCIRVPLHEGDWALEPVDGGKRTHAIYRFRMELGGSLPMWLARGRAGKDVPALFDAIRNQVQFYR
jgi:uncharacterized protein YndB with AHSA1/START domain